MALAPDHQMVVDGDAERGTSDGISISFLEPWKFKPDQFTARLVDNERE
jgi:hypothetical protein